jgi:hypothetical protein
LWQVPPPGSKISLSDSERKEKMALEKKLSEMEEELKVTSGVDFSNIVFRK